MVEENNLCESDARLAPINQVAGAPFHGSDCVSGTADFVVHWVPAAVKVLLPSGLEAVSFCCGWDVVLSPPAGDHPVASLILSGRLISTAPSHACL